MVKGGYFSECHINIFIERKYYNNVPSTREYIINSYYKTSNLEWWFSYKHIMPQIAESSPRSFVSFINDDLTKG